MDSAAGIVIVAVVMLWLAYLVPQRLKQRQQLLESRIDDRFSGRLRILAVAAEGPGDTARTPGRAPSAVTLHPLGDCTTSSSADVSLLTPPHGMDARPQRHLTDGEQDMERTDPHSPHLDAVRARRAAAARRRATLTVALLVLSVATGLLGAFSPVPGWTVAIPGVLLVTVLVLGRRAVLAQNRADAAVRREARVAQPQARTVGRPGRPAPAVRPSVTGRAVHSSQSHTEMISRVGGAAAAAVSTTGKPVSVRPGGAVVQAAPERAAAPEKGAEAVAEVVATEAAAPVAEAPRPAVGTVVATVSAPAAEDAEWAPVAVPRPVYVMKSAAPRWEPAPLTAELRQLTEERRALLSGDAEVLVVDEGAEVETGAEAPSDSLGVSLDSVLARRRAAGE